MIEKGNMQIEINKDIFYEGLPFFAESLILNGTIAVEIEKIYKDKKEIYYRLNQDYWNENSQNSLFRNGTLEREIKCNHCMGVLLASIENDGVKQKLLKLIERQYSQMFILSKKASPKLWPYVVEYFQKAKSASDSNSYLRIAYLLLVLHHGFSIVSTGNDLQQLVDAMEKDVVDRRVYQEDKKKQSYATLISQNIEAIKKLQEDHKDCQTCQDILKINDAIDSKKGRNLTTQKGIESREDTRNYLAVRNVFTMVAGIFDYRGLSYSLLLKDTELAKEEKQIIALFDSVCEKQSSFAEQEYIFDHLYVFGVILSSLTKEYLKAKAVCQENLSDELYTEISVLKKRLEKLSETERTLREKLENHAENAEKISQKHEKQINDVKSQSYQEIDVLKKRIEELEKEKQDWLEERYDYDRLKELAYALEMEIETEPEEDLTLAEKILSEKRVFLLGGHENWHAQLKRELPALNLVSGTQHSVKPEIFQKADYVLLFSGHMAHTVYDKVKDYLYKRKIPYDYLPSTQLNYIKRTVIAWYNKEERR